MKEAENIDSLTAAVLSNNSKVEVKQRLEAWIKLSGENELPFRHLEKIWKERFSDPDFKNFVRLKDLIWEKAM